MVTHHAGKSRDRWCCLVHCHPNILHKLAPASTYPATLVPTKRLLALHNLHHIAPTLPAALTLDMAVPATMVSACPAQPVIAFPLCYSAESDDNKDTLSVCLSHLSLCPSVCLSTASVRLSVCLSVGLSVCMYTLYCTVLCCITPLLCHCRFPVRASKADTCALSH